MVHESSMQKPNKADVRSVRVGVFLDLLKKLGRKLRVGFYRCLGVISLRAIRHCDIKRRTRGGSVMYDGIHVRKHRRRRKLALVGFASHDRGARAGRLVVLHRRQIRQCIHSRSRRLSRRGQFSRRGSSPPSSHVWTNRRTHGRRGGFGNVRRCKNMLRKRRRGHSSSSTSRATASPETLLRWTGRRRGSWRRAGCRASRLGIRFLWRKQRIDVHSSGFAKSVKVLKGLRNADDS